MISQTNKQKMVQQYLKYKIPDLCQKYCPKQQIPETRIFKN